MILLIDNYDSFTHNLYHQLSAFSQDVKIVRNDEITVEEVKLLNPSAIVISPGPGEPREAGITIPLIQALYKDVPILGVCLGHQAIGEAFGASIVRANNIMHGKTSVIDYKNEGLFASISGQYEVMRYHSLIIDPSTLPNELRITATSAEDQEIMAVQHQQYPVYGVQFHPESIGTVRGNELIEAFFIQIGLLAV
jgi:anthranilate synthase component II